RAEKALRAWEQGSLGHLHFVRSTSAAAADILNIGVGDMAAMGYTSSPRGLTGVGGGTFDPATHTIHSGVVWLDISEYWETTYANGNVSGSFDAFTVFAGHIGHALGFGHTDALTGANVLNSKYGGEKPALSLNDLAFV